MFSVRVNYRMTLHIKRSRRRRVGLTGAGGNACHRDRPAAGWHGRRAPWISILRRYLLPRLVMPSGVGAWIIDWARSGYRCLSDDHATRMVIGLAWRIAVFAAEMRKATSWHCAPNVR